MSYSSFAFLPFIFLQTRPLAIIGELLLQTLQVYLFQSKEIINKKH